MEQDGWELGSDVGCADGSSVSEDGLEEREGALEIDGSRLGILVGSRDTEGDELGSDDGSADIEGVVLGWEDGCADKEGLNDKEGFKDGAPLG